MQGRLRRNMMVAIAAGLMAVLAATAFGSTRTRTFSVPAGGQEFGRVACPHGQHVKSFGVAGQFSEFDDSASDVPEELALTDARHVIAGARSTGTVSGSFDATAVCGHAPALSQEVDARNVDVGAQASVKAKCPRGTAIRLGGFRQELGPPQSDGPFVMINGLERTSNRTWTVSAINVGAASGRLSSFAYCGDQVHEVHAVTRTTNVHSGHYGRATARCPRGSKFLMGGLRVQHYDTFAGDIYVTEMGPAGRRGWTVRGFKYLPVFGHLTAIAYCRG